MGKDKHCLEIDKMFQPFFFIFFKNIAFYMRILHFLGTIWRLNTFFEVFVVEPFPWGQLARIADVDSW